MQSAEQERETELAAALVAGYPGAFEHFVDYFRAKVFHYSWLMCGHREDAEEVAQETLMKVFENADKLREPNNVKSWVFRIAKNACLMKRRRSVHAPSRELSLDEFLPSKRSGNGQVRIEIADWSKLPDDSVLRSEMRGLLEKAIRELPDLYRAVLLLRDIEEFSTQETAQVLDISEDLVKTRLHRARLSIRRTIDGYLQAGGVHHAASSA